MENSVACVFKAQNFCSPVLLSRTSKPLLVQCPRNYYSGSLRLIKQPWRNKKLWKVVNCAKGGSVSGAEAKKWVDEIITEEELMGFGRSREKCKDTENGGGIAELMECLEREAIMGEDEGKEPTDYNRRAQIFDKSSRVFQSLKESTITITTTTPSTTTTTS